MFYWTFIIGPIEIISPVRLGTNNWRPTTPEVRLVCVAAAT